MAKAKFTKSIFFKPKNKKLARAISIKSPTAFRESIRKVKKMRGVSDATKKRVLVLARARAAAQLKRKRLSMKERKQFRAIVKTGIGI